MSQIIIYSPEAHSSTVIYIESVVMIIINHYTPTYVRLIIIYSLRVLCTVLSL